MTIIFEDLIMWLLYLIYIQGGIVVGIGIERKYKKKKGAEPDSELKHGTKGRMITGIGLSLGLQLYDVNYAFVWGIGVLVSTVWSVYPLLFVYVQKRINESEALQREVEAIKRVVEEALDIKIEIDPEEIKGKDTKERESIIVEQIVKANNGNGHVEEDAEKSKEPGITILSKIT